MSIIVRKAILEDAKELFRLNKEFNGENVATIENIEDSLLHNDSEIVMIAFLDGQAAGFITGYVCRSMCYRSLHGEIGELFVGVKYRRCGVAKQLMLFLEQEFRKKDALVVTLATSVQNNIAQSFYEDCGYSGKQKYIYRKNI